VASRSAPWVRTASAPLPPDLHANADCRSVRRHGSETSFRYRPVVVLIADAVAGPIVLEGCGNFRDVGGVRAANGAVVRARRLFRSNALVAALPDDLLRLYELGVATIVDLRSDDERAWGGNLGGGVTTHALPLGDLISGEDAWERWRDPVYVAARYFEMCLAASASITEVFAVLTDPAAYPVVVQCSLGKDRTGVVVALLLRAIGVPVRDIAAEYARSRAGAFKVVDRLRREVDAELQRALDPYLPAMLSADPVTMVRFLGLIDDEFGSMTGYLRHLDIVSAIPFLGAALLT
jgi:protein-tyrosine phosphatase